jgi:hypothetical protein
MSYTHGTYTAYGRYRCRCVACVAYQNGRNQRNRADRKSSGRLSHGTRSAYDAGCRCDDCLGARRAVYEVENAARRERAS